MIKRDYYTILQRSKPKRRGYGSRDRCSCSRCSCSRCSCSRCSRFSGSWPVRAHPLPVTVCVCVCVCVAGIVYKPPEYKEHDFTEAPKFTAALNDRAATVGYSTKLLCAVRGSPKVRPHMMTGYRYGTEGVPIRY